MDIEERFLRMVILAVFSGESVSASLSLIKTVCFGTAESHGAADGYVNVK
jgi:hypothetical protein